MKLQNKKMKKLLFAVILVFCISLIQAQKQNPVSWSASATKQADGNYKVIVAATVPAPWHLYSQSTPDGGPVATSFTFTKNPLLSLVGKVTEKGDLKTTHDKNFGVDVKYYSGKVEFIQIVKVKNNVKTNISGSVNFMVCNDHECLPPSDQEFSVKLN